MHQTLKNLAAWTRQEQIVSRKVQLVTSKLDQAHGKAREIEAIVIASIAFDNRFCHALTLNRSVLLSNDLEGSQWSYQGPGGVWPNGGTGDLQHGEKGRCRVQPRSRSPLWLEIASTDNQCFAWTEAREEPTRASIDYLRDHLQAPSWVMNNILGGWFSP